MFVHKADNIRVDVEKNCKNIKFNFNFIYRAQRLLLSKGINIIDSIFGKTESKTKYQALGSILVQIGLIDIFVALELQPTNYFGKSFGEILAAYFDGILTFKQTIDCAFAINDAIDKINEGAEKHRVRLSKKILRII